jgi:hypothetical protein
MSKRKFYRTVIQIEILSEDPYETNDLNTIEYDITEGRCSGNAKDIIRNEVKNGKEMADLLTAQGSAPEFFNLNDAGENVDD